MGEGDKTLSDIGWLVGRRNQIQTLSASLYSLLSDDTKRAVIAGNSQDRRTAGLLAGTVFSLWRAVFLAHDPNDASEQANLENEVKFLEKMIRTNAIAFGDEHGARIWTFGLYLNNAKFRIQRLRTDLDKTKMNTYTDRLREENISGKTLLEWIDLSIHDWPTRANAWDGYFRATELGYECFAQYY